MHLALLPLLLAAPGETVELHAAWGPVASSTYRLHHQFEEVSARLSAGPRTPVALHPSSALKALLPIGATAPTDVWALDVDEVLPFLAQLDPGVTKELRHDGPAVEGGYATLLRATPEALEVLLRVHVEFELVEDELWLLPAQFEGHLVWDCVANAPRSFHLALPSRDTNYDLCYGRTIDIGHLPLMTVGTAGSARPTGAAADAARARLRAAFYPSDRIAWHASLADAFAAAQESGKRLHVMQLFGTLDDESC